MPTGEGPFSRLTAPAPATQSKNPAQWPGWWWGVPRGLKTEPCADRPAPRRGPPGQQLGQRQRFPWRQGLAHIVPTSTLNVTAAGRSRLRRGQAWCPPAQTGRRSERIRPSLQPGDVVVHSGHAQARYLCADARRRLAWWPCSVKSVMAWRMAARFWPGLWARCLWGRGRAVAEGVIAGGRHGHLSGTAPSLPAHGESAKPWTRVRPCRRCNPGFTGARTNPTACGGLYRHWWKLSRAPKAKTRHWAGSVMVRFEIWPRLRSHRSDIESQRHGHGTTTPIVVEASGSYVCCAAGTVAQIINLFAQKRALTAFWELSSSQEETFRFSITPPNVRLGRMDWSDGERRTRSGSGRNRCGSMLDW